MRVSGDGGLRGNTWNKRLAAQVASQLPEDEAHALAVLDLARSIIVNLGMEWPTSTPEPVRLAFSKKDGEES